MTIFFFNNKDYQKEVIFFIILYFTLIISFFFGEDSTGGAFRDYANQKKAVQSFATQFLNTFYEYDSFQTRHSPILIIFLSLFKKIKGPVRMHRAFSISQKELVRETFVNYFTDTTIRDDVLQNSMCHKSSKWQFG